MNENSGSDWLALIIGNSRLHWAWFVGADLKHSWDTPHLDAEAVSVLRQHQWKLSDWLSVVLSEQHSQPPQLAALQRLSLSAAPPLWTASVVPSQLALWQEYPRHYQIKLEQVPIRGLYPTLGIDRALALLGTANRSSWPALVIDAGTALTLTGADANGLLVGGAILPGLGLQLRSLAQNTAALPAVEPTLLLPPRWALNTSDAIYGGVVYTLIAGLHEFIEAWLQDWPGSAIALTGGDRLPIFAGLQRQYPQLAAQIHLDPHLMFWGMRAIAVAG